MKFHGVHPLGKLVAVVLASALVGFGAYRAVAADPPPPEIVPAEHHDPGEELGPSTYLPAVQGGADANTGKANADTLYTLRVFVCVAQRRRHTHRWRLRCAGGAWCGLLAGAGQCQRHRTLEGQRFPRRDSEHADWLCLQAFRP